jgi:hypothetical protein
VVDANASAGAILHTDGIVLRDSSGTKVVLKSINVDWNERVKKYRSTSGGSSPGESWFTAADISQIKAAGGNCVEVHMLLTKDLMPTRGVSSTSYFTTWIDVWVNWCTQYGIRCILTISAFDPRATWAIPYWLWQGIYSTPTTQAGWSTVIRDFFDLNVAKQNINRAAFVDLWKFIANRYKANPYVMYGIMNEPLCGVTIPDAATCTHLGQTYSKFMENVVDGIRSVGSNQIVIIDRPYVTQFSPYYGNVQPVNRDGIMWEDHIYMETSSSHGWNYWTSWIGTFVSRICGVFKKPLFIGEYGFDPVTAIRTTYPSSWRTMLSNMVARLNSLQLAGRQWHTWGYLYGEYYTYDGKSPLTAEESAFIVKTVLG